MKIRKNAKFEIRVNLCEKICVKNEFASKMFCYHISPLLRVFEVLGKIQKDMVFCGIITVLYCIKATTEEW